MPTFYEGKPIEVIEQTVKSADWASAYYAAQSTVSPIHRRDVKTGICVTASSIITSFVPIYRSKFSTVWVPICGIIVILALGFFFFFIQPNDIRHWAEELYRSNALLSLPEKITIYRDSVIIENEHEQILEYWTDFARCIETKNAFVIAGGLERDLLTIPKSGLTAEQVDKLSAHFADTFASRYQKSKGGI